MSASSPNQPVLAAMALSKSYRSGAGSIAVLRDAALDVFAGQSVSIRGESGSGKSTLLNLLAGLDRPDSGTVEWKGRSDLAPADRAALLGIVFQAFYLVPELDAFGNVLLGARVAGKPLGPARARAAQLLERVGLKDRGHHLPSELSGGEQQRVALARALVNGPELLLADEPTGNLDERTADSMIELLLGMCRETGTALVLVSHNPEHATRTDRRLILHDGILHEG